MLIQGIPEAYRQPHFIQILYFCVGLCKNVQGMIALNKISYAEFVFVCIYKSVKKGIEMDKGKKKPPAC